LKGFEMKEMLSIVLVFSIFFAGCAGREGNPIAAYQPNDEKRDCASLEAEMAQLDTQIATLLPKSNKAPWNTLMIVTGIFVIVPFFFMDLKNGEQVELQACRQRRNALALIAAQNGCVVANPGAGASK
jgi:hypothetical protein